MSQRPIKGDHVLVAADGTFEMVGSEFDREMVEDTIRELYQDPEYTAFTNVPIICADPEIQSRISYMPHADEYEIEEAMDRHVERRRVWTHVSVFDVSPQLFAEYASWAKDRKICHRSLAGQLLYVYWRG